MEGVAWVENRNSMCVKRIKEKKDRQRNTEEREREREEERDVVLQW